MVSKRPALLSDVHHRNNSVLRNPGLKGSLLWRPCSVERLQVASLRFARTQYDSWLALVEVPIAICQEVCEQLSYLGRKMYASATILLGQPGPQRRRS